MRAGVAEFFREIETEAENVSVKMREGLQNELMRESMNEQKSLNARGRNAEFMFADDVWVQAVYSMMECASFYIFLYLLVFMF